jgi:release factor glutamine methyltransferase
VTAGSARRGEATWADLLRSAAARLGDAQQARWMIEEVSGEPWGTASAETPVPSAAGRRVASMVERRLGGEPLQYVLGRWGFRRLELAVDARVLIPRPETEQVVEVAIQVLDAVAGAARPANVVDLGTGSGAIALSIAAERRNARVWATDVDAAALEVASANLSGLAGRAACRVHLCRGSWWGALPRDLAGTVDLAVSNPPYVATAEMAALEAQVRDWEPAGALEAGPTGLEAVAEILGAAPSWLRPGGAAVVEIAPRLSAVAIELALSSGFARAAVRRDLGGRERILVAETDGLPVAGGLGLPVAGAESSR